MRALKSLVVFMGILIAIGITVVGVTIYRRATDTTAADASRGSATVAPAPAVTGARPGGLPLPGFAARDLDLPAGSAVVSVQTLDSRVLVHARLPDGGTRILLLDPASGATIGEWRVPGGALPPP
jgi:hypothetical protein